MSFELYYKLTQQKNPFLVFPQKCSKSHFELYKRYMCSTVHDHHQGSGEGKEPFLRSLLLLLSYMEMEGCSTLVTFIQMHRVLLCSSSPGLSVLSSVKATTSLAQLSSKRSQSPYSIHYSPFSKGKSKTLAPGSTEFG